MLAAAAVQAAELAVLGVTTGVLPGVAGVVSVVPGLTALDLILEETLFMAVAEARGVARALVKITDVQQGRVVARGEVEAMFSPAQVVQAARQVIQDTAERADLVVRLDRLGITAEDLAVVVDGVLRAALAGGRMKV
jgi:hypothetical protein